MTTWIHNQRLDAAQQAVLQSDACSLLDLGCGDGDLMTRLATIPQIKEITGVDLSREVLQRLQERLDKLGDTTFAQINLICGSMMENHTPSGNVDCAVLVESIEHIPPERLSVLERLLFFTIKPETVVITTPNADFNPLLGVPHHRFRHPGHYFEWGREKFGCWAQGVSGRNHYQVTVSDIGGCHPIYGGASQMAVFHKLRHQTLPD